MNGIGMLVRDGYLDVEMVYDYMWNMVIWGWAKWESIIREQRVRYNLPKYHEWFEYLDGEMRRIHEQRGLKVEYPENFARYDPELKT